MNKITFEQIDQEHFAIVAVISDIQVGWCRRLSLGWQLSDIDENLISDPFETLEQAKSYGIKFFLSKSGASNPGY